MFFSLRWQKCQSIGRYFVNGITPFTNMKTSILDQLFRKNIRVLLVQYGGQGRNIQEEEILKLPDLNFFQILLTLLWTTSNTLFGLCRSKPHRSEFCKNICLWYTYDSIFSFINGLIPLIFCSVFALLSSNLLLSKNSTCDESFGDLVAVMEDFCNTPPNMRHGIHFSVLLGVNQYRERDIT